MAGAIAMALPMGRSFMGRTTIDDKAEPVLVTTEPRPGTVELHCGYGCCNQSLYVPENAVGKQGRLKADHVQGAYVYDGWLYCNKQHLDDASED